MVQLDGFYPDMTDFPIHEYCCRQCGALLELPDEDWQPDTCEDCDLTMRPDDPED